MCDLATMSDSPPDDETLVDEFLVTLATTVDALSREVTILRTLLEQADLWNSGLMKLVLSQEFRYWRQVGAHAQPQLRIGDLQRDRAAAESALDHFVDHLPEPLRQGVWAKRDALIETLMDQAGHEPLN
jgi:hypothetical protein